MVLQILPTSGGCSYVNLPMRPASTYQWLKPFSYTVHCQATPTQRFVSFLLMGVLCCKQLDDGAVPAIGMLWNADHSSGYCVLSMPVAKEQGTLTLLLPLQWTLLPSSALCIPVTLHPLSSLFALRLVGLVCSKAWVTIPLTFPLFRP